MTVTPTLEEGDARAVIRLLGEVAMVEGNHATKRRALMEGLNDLIDADMWLICHGTIDNPQRWPMVFSVVHDGATDEEIAAMADYGQDLDHPLLEHERSRQLAETYFVERGQQCTARRNQIITDEEWYDNPVEVQRHQRLGYDDFLMTGYPLDDRGLYSLLEFFRRHGRPKFTDRDCRLVHIVAAEIPWLHYEGAPVGPSNRARELTPRERAILALMLDGWDRKAMSRELGLSFHTVGDYMKRIYKRFNVDGQVALLHQFMAGERADAI